jgi:hypothetical protein
MDDFSSFYAASALAEQLKQANIAHEARTQIYRYLESPLIFAEWLMRLDPTIKIGNAGRNEYEPFIRFLREKTNQKCDLLDDHTIYISSLAGNITLPGWVSEYLKRITKEGKAYGDYVQVKDCLDALNLPS